MFEDALNKGRALLGLTSQEEKCQAVEKAVYDTADALNRRGFKATVVPSVMPVPGGERQTGWNLVVTGMYDGLPTMLPIHLLTGTWGENPWLGPSHLPAWDAVHADPMATRLPREEAVFRDVVWPIHQDDATHRMPPQEVLDRLSAAIALAMQPLPRVQQG